MVLKTAVKKFIKYIECKEYARNTVKGYESVLQDFTFFMENFEGQDFQIRKIKAYHMDDYMIYRREKGDEAVTRNRSVYILRSFFNFLCLKDYVLSNEGMKLEAVRYCPKERLFLNRQEMEELIEAVEHPVVKYVVMTLMHTGLRISELCHLTIYDVDMDARLIEVRKAKGNKNRSVPINQSLCVALRKYLEQERYSKKPTDRFFCTSRSGQISPQYVNQIIGEAVENLKWTKHVTAHILRHSFASQLIRNNAHVSSVQALLGHSDLRITSRYIHQEMGMLREAVERLV